MRGAGIMIDFTKRQISVNMMVRISRSNRISQGTDMLHGARFLKFFAAFCCKPEAVHRRLQLLNIRFDGLGPV